MTTTSDADKAKRLVLIRAAWKRYAKERARMEYTLRRAGSVEHWHFAGRTKESRWGQIGMAMPPALAEAVARAVVEHFAARIGDRARGVA